MIRCLDECDNIDTFSKHNAQMISAYLHNLAVVFESDLTDEQYGLLVRCADFLWIFSNAASDMDSDLDDNIVEE